MKKLSLFFLIFIFLLIKNSVFAQENNFYGIHLAQPHLTDLIKVKELINSNGGDWGYVTLVIQENDLDKKKWQNIFDLLREYHLIPIIRLATSPQGENWRKGEKEDINKWVDFLDSLNWVIKKRYIVLFNEPNHGREWGGEVDPESYAKVAFHFAKTLKEKNPDFFIMLAGFDASSPHQPPKFWDEELFLKEMIKIIPVDLWEKYLDGWASHSYPNPAFSQPPYLSGRGTIKTYEFEKELLKNLGFKKDLPVFITETGWERKTLSEKKVAEYFQYAFLNVWGVDNSVFAVTPFVFDYQQEPFLGFSWKKYQSDDFYQQYYLVKSLPKKKGQPEQEEKGKISFSLPKELVAYSFYSFSLDLKNEGQAIWDKDDGYQIEIINEEKSKNTHYSVEKINPIKPKEKKTIFFNLKTIDASPKEKIRFRLIKDSKKVIESSVWQFKVLPLPSLVLEGGFWPWGALKGDDFEVQIFDWEEKLVFKKTNVSFFQGKAKIENINNVTLGDLFRVVLIKKGYLPRQSYYVFHKDENIVSFKKLLPFDFDFDQKLSLNDLFFLLKRKK